MKRPSQQGPRGGDQGMGGGQMQRDGPPQRREIKLPSSSLVRVERVEDPNVWKPKHAVAKPKEDDASVALAVCTECSIFFLFPHFFLALFVSTLILCNHQ